MADDREQLFTRKQMFDALRERELEPPKLRTFHDWVAQGLVDQASEHRGAGKRSGSREGRWPREQLELLALIVRKRPEAGDGRGAIGVLANIPTFLWLEWGEPYAPVRQVRRAVATWAESYFAGRSWKRSKAEATRVAQMIKADSADPVDVEALSDALTSFVWNKGRLGGEGVLVASAKVIDPDGSGQEFGAPGASLNAEKLLVSAQNLDWGAGRVIDDRGAESSGRFWFSDHDYQVARTHWAASLAEYKLMQPLLSAHGPAAVYEAPQPEDLMNAACRHLVELLGYLDPRNPHLPIGRR
jgi:hypothetical protein